MSLFLLYKDVDVFSPVLQHYRYSFTKWLAIKCFTSKVIIPKICFIFPGWIDTRDVFKWNSFTQGEKIKNVHQKHIQRTCNTVYSHAFTHRTKRKGQIYEIYGLYNLSVIYLNNSSSILVCTVYAIIIWAKIWNLIIIYCFHVWANDFSRPREHFSDISMTLQDSYVRINPKWIDNCKSLFSSHLASKSFRCIKRVWKMWRNFWLS